MKKNIITTLFEIVSYSVHLLEHALLIPKVPHGRVYMLYGGVSFHSDIHSSRPPTHCHVDTHRLVIQALSDHRGSAELAENLSNLGDCSPSFLLESKTSNRLELECIEV